MPELIDGLFFAVLFLLRLGLPLALTLLVGRWLEKKLQPRTAQDRSRLRPPSRSPHSVRAQPLHCWELAHCPPLVRAHCAAYRHPELPCWLALQVEGRPVRPECFTCGLYSPQEIAA